MPIRPRIMEGEEDPSRYRIVFDTFPFEVLPNGYDICIVEEGQPPSFSPPTMQVNGVTAAAVPFTPGPDGTRYTAYIRSRTQFGYVSEPAATPVKLVSSGTALVIRPDSPTVVIAQSISGGSVRLSWNHTRTRGSDSVAEFRVYGDGGVGGPVNYSSALATAAASDRSVPVPGLAEGVQHRLAVRAIGSAGQSDGGLATVLAVPRYTVPPDIGAITLSQSS